MCHSQYLSTSLRLPVHGRPRRRKGPVSTPKSKQKESFLKSSYRFLRLYLLLEIRFASNQHSSQRRSVCRKLVSPQFAQSNHSRHLTGMVEIPLNTNFWTRLPSSTSET